MTRFIQKSLIILAGCFLAGILNTSFALNSTATDENAFPYEIQATTAGTDTTDIGKIVTTDSVNPDTGLLKILTNFFRLSWTTYNDGTNHNTATNYVKRILNIVLGLISFIALIMIIFAFYLIFFSKGEEGVGKARKILIGVVIALALLWLSRLIVAFLFNIFGVATA